MADYKLRAKRYYIPLTFKNGLLISTRRFRTNSGRRSKRYRQMVIRIYWPPIKELAIRKITHRAAKRLLDKQHSRPKLKSPWLSYPRIYLILMIVAASAGSVFFGLQLDKPSQIYLTGKRTVKVIQPPTAAAAAPTLPRSLPVHIKINAVGIDADIVQTGLDANRAVAVPEDWHMAGWYKYSPTPGERGPSIIVGHVDNVSGLGVFWRLHEMSVGDKIDVSRADGRIAKFSVDEIAQYPRDNFPSQKVYGSIDEAGLRLITCGGSFDRSIREYNENTVVFAHLVN